MQELDESMFARSNLVEGGQSAWKRYALMTTGDQSIISLLRYELVVSLVGSIPGALGYVLRKMLFPSLFRRCGRSVVFGKSMVIRHARNIEIGNSVVLDDNVVLDGRGASNSAVRIGNETIVGRGSIIQSKFGPLDIGDHCNIGSNSVLVSTGGMKIGDWVQIAGGCKISGGTFKIVPSSDGGRPYKRLTKGPIEIGTGTFLGGSVDVTDGVKIGKGSAIGTGAVVTSDVPDDAVLMPRPGVFMPKSSKPTEPVDDAKKVNPQSTVEKSG